MKKIIALFLSVLMLVGCFSMSVFAAGAAVTFDLSCEGKNSVIKENGDTIEVRFTILRTDADAAYEINALQNYIAYDEDFFEFVEGSAECTHVDSKGRPIGFAGLVKAITRNKVYMTDMMDRLPASCDFGTFQMKVIGRSGSGRIWNNEVKAYLAGSVPIEITCNDLTVTIGTPLPDEYTVTYNAGAGTVTPASETVEVAQSVTLPQATRPDYELEGWSDGITVYKAGAAYTPVSDITLKAEWIHNAPVIRAMNASEGDADGALLNTTTAMEYSKDGVNWIACGDGLVERLSAGTYQVRYAATETEKAGKITRVRIEQNAYEPEPEPEVEIPITGDTTGIHVSADIIDGNAKLNVDAAELEAVIGKNIVTGNVVIDLTGGSELIKGVVIPRNALTAISAAASSTTNDTRALTIRMKVGSVTLDAKTLKAAVESGTGDLELVVEDIGLNDLNAAQRSVLAGKNVHGIFDIYMTENGERISNLNGGKVTVSINQLRGEAQDIASANVYYVSPEGKMTVLAHQTADGQFIFEVVHLSIYAIISGPDAETECPRDETCPIAPYKDTDKTMWWHDGIHFCVENGLMIGLDDATFAPNMTVDRAMAVMVLWRISGRPAVNASAKPFDDVDTGCWYTEPICWAKSTGVVEGYGDGIFGPVDRLTREQLAVILYRFAAPDSVSSAVLPFSDVDSINSWAVDAVRWCYANGIVMGRDTGCFDPQGTATRAEAAAMFQRFCRISG